MNIMPKQQGISASTKASFDAKWPTQFFKPSLKNVKK